MAIGWQMKIRYLIACGLIVLSPPALGADCQPLKYLGAVPIELNETGGVQVTALLNGVPVKLVLSRSGFADMTKTTATSLRLKERDSSVKTYTSNNEVFSTYVTVSRFTIGPVSGQDMSFLVTGDASQHSDTIPIKIFENYDLDFDFVSNRLNLFSPEHCNGAVTYWTTGPVAAVPYDGPQMTIDILLDGHATKAVMSIGNIAETLMGMREAKNDFGITVDSPDTKPYQFPSGGSGYRHVFSTMSFAGVTIKNPAVVIMPEKLNTMFQERPTGSLVAESQFKDLRRPISIGENVIKLFHIYVSTKEHKLYITPGDANAGKLLPPLTQADVR